MSSIFDKWNQIVVLVAVVAAGCKMGVPMDKNVQISRHFGGEDTLDVAPETRLSRSGITKPAIAGVATKTGQEPSIDNPEPVIESLSDLGIDDRTQRAVANKPPESKQAGSTIDLSSPEAQLMQAAGLDDAELADLLAAFRGSPPEVQQQAIRQLIAAASVRAKTSANPIDITEQLKQSLEKLPSLPDVIEDSSMLPTRLASTSPSESVQPQSASADALLASSATPTAAAPSSNGDQQPAPIAQAVVATADAENSVAKVSSINAEPSALVSGAPANAMVMPATGIEGQPPTNLDKNALFKQMVSALSKAEPGESDGDRFRRDLARRYALVLSGDPDSAVLAMEGLTKPEQEFLRHNLLAVWKMTDPDGHPVASRRFAAALSPYRTATRHLSEATEQLEVNSLALCNEIISYGQVKRFATTRFDPGQKVILYCEIDNFVAEKTADGYETELQGSYEIFNDQGTKVAGQVLPTDRQRCDHYLRDYFIAYQMHLPAQLTAGKYRLELTMECAKGKKYGQGSMPLEIK
ncbi:MAG TPA: hypothetical protein DDZ51_08445 [Planctomycetaceae bacterium]|nr:hypothetical protein [Planctomycetaceae bacterium]